MSALVALLIAAQAPPPQVPFVAMPPVDWSTLPELTLLRAMPAIPELSSYVRAEVAAGRCSVAQPSVRVDVAVLVDPRGAVRRIVPRAINCPTVEQYASGIVSRLARRNVAASPTESWYRTSVTFAWTP